MVSKKGLLYVYVGNTDKMYCQENFWNCIALRKHFLEPIFLSLENKKKSLGIRSGK